jgi:hypothetical protein
MHTVPDKERDLIAFTKELIEQCRVSVGNRTAYCRLMNAITETGRYDGTKSLLNWLYWQLSSKAEHIFSPVELKFTLDFDRAYSKDIYEKAAVVGKQITRHWDRTNTDFLFGEGVFESLKYGACILKQWAQVEGEGQQPNYYAKLVMPWQFGVINEAENELSRQSAFCETTRLTLPEVWRRIYHLPNRKALFDRIKSQATKGGSMSEPQSYFHQVLSTSQLQTGVQQSTRPLPGGIVQLNNDPNYSIMGPQVAVETVEFHELWVQDFDDYTTIQMVEPDIIISPPVIGGSLMKKANLLGVPGCQPYTLIQTNSVTNWFWGRSELVDLIEPQGLLSTWLDDSKRLMGLQIDKFLGFSGEGGMTEETYGSMRAAGYINMPQGSQITDLTPKFPPELLPIVEFLIKQMLMIGGFPEIMRGQGEPGVRAGVHADTLMKTASPQLRGAALKGERQCAMAADLTLQIKEAKDPARYWTKGDTIQDVEKTSFLLTDMPNDWRVTVDSHSSSPIFSDENTQLIVGSHKMGIVDGEYMLDNLPFPDKDAAKARLKEKEAKQQQMMQDIMQHRPDIGDKLLEKQLTGGGKKK